MKKTIIAAVIVLTVGIIGLMITVVSAGNPFNTVETNKQSKVPMEGIQHIAVSGADVDIVLNEQESSEEIKVALKGKMNKSIQDKYKMKVKKNGDTLDVSIENHSFQFFVINSSYLEILLPSEVYQSVTATTSSGDITSNGITANKISFKSSSGDISTKNNKIEEIYVVESSSGDILSVNDQSQQATLTSSSGDVSTSALDSLNTEVASQSGDIFLKKGSGNLLLKSSSGDIHVKGDPEGIKVESKSGDISIESVELKDNVDISSSSGDVSLHYSKKPKSFKLTYQGNSGDGIVLLKGVKYDVKSENALSGQIGGGKHLIKVKTESGDFVLQ